MIRTLFLDEVCNLVGGRLPFVDSACNLWKNVESVSYKNNFIGSDLDLFYLGQLRTLRISFHVSIFSIRIHFAYIITILSTTTGTLGCYFLSLKIFIPYKNIQFV